MSPLLKSESREIQHLLLALGCQPAGYFYQPLNDLLGLAALQRWQQAGQPGAEAVVFYKWKLI